MLDTLALWANEIVCKREGGNDTERFQAALVVGQ